MKAHLEDDDGRIELAILDALSYAVDARRMSWLAYGEALRYFRRMLGPRRMAERLARLNVEQNTRLAVQQVRSMRN